MSDQATERLAGLPDGRVLSYRSVGPEDGALVLYLHGAIGSPQSASPELEAVTRAVGIRYVIVSRPGFGASSADPGRTLLSFARDAGTLADHLRCERFAVVGVSAGAPYALACAHDLPGRVTAAAVVSGMGPGGGGFAGLPPPLRLALAALRARPRTCALAGDAVLAAARRHPRLVAAVMRAGAPPTDRCLLAESELSECAAARFLAAASGGIGGMIDDYLVCARPWGFRLADVRPLVHLWHGVQDTLVPVDQALHLAAQLPRVHVALHPDEGHFFYRRRLLEILGELVPTADSSSRAATQPPESFARSCGAVTSMIGPAGTIRVGLMLGCVM